MRTTPRRTEIALLLARHKREGLTYAELAEISGVRPTTLSWWAWKLRRVETRDGSPKPTGAVSFVEVVPESVEDSDRIEIVLRNGRRILAATTVDGDALGRLATVLESC